MFSSKKMFQHILRKNKQFKNMFSITGRFHIKCGDCPQEKQGEEEIIQ
jgi:hypothetical protein